VVNLAPWENLPQRALLFGEAQGRIIISTNQLPQFLAAVQKFDVPVTVIGSTAPRELGLTMTGAGTELKVGLDELIAAYHDSLEHAMSQSIDSSLATARGETEAEVTA
jgi:phosphoribosylformylglycinamidine synthase